MKNLILAASLVTLVSCGKPVNETLEHVNSDFVNIIEVLHEIPTDIVDDHIKGDKKKVSEEELNEVEEVINDELERIDDKIEELEKLIGDLEVNQDELEDEINELNRRLTDIETDQTTTLIFDPCGNLPNYFDQTILVVSHGNTKEFYSKNKKGKLKKLKDGTYKTKDKQKCIFMIYDGEINLKRYNDHDDD